MKNMTDLDRIQALHRFVTHNRDEARHLRLSMAAYLLDVAKLELEKNLPKARDGKVKTQETQPLSGESSVPAGHES